MNLASPDQLAFLAAGAALAVAALPVASAVRRLAEAVAYRAFLAWHRGRSKGQEDICRELRWAAQVYFHNEPAIAAALNELAAGGHAHSARTAYKQATDQAAFQGPTPCP